MVIRELLDCFDKEISGHKAALKRLEAARTRVLSCCREAKSDAAPALRIHSPGEDSQECRGKTRAAA